MVKIANADAFVYSGIGLEGFADKAQSTLKNEDVALVEAAKGIKLAKNLKMSMPTKTNMPMKKSITTEIQTLTFGLILF